MTTMANIGRNDPCACGSGNKYKKCCLAAKAPLSGHAVMANAAAPIHVCDFCIDDDINEEIERLADRAFDLLLDGRDDEAEPLCHQLMREFPNEVEGVDLLSMVYEARGDLKRALELQRQALSIADSYFDFDAETRRNMYERKLKLEMATSPS